MATGGHHQGDNDYKLLHGTHPLWMFVSLSGCPAILKNYFHETRADMAMAVGLIMNPVPEVDVPRETRPQATL